MSHADLPVPKLIPHDWSFPGLSPEDSARAGIAISEEYADVLAATIRQHGMLSSSQVLSLIPDAWKRLLGRWAHGNLSHRQAEQRGIHAEYVGHDASGNKANGGFHFTYRVQAGAIEG